MLALWVVPVAALAQGDRAMKTARQSVVDRFEASAPAVGQLAPDVALVDSRGRVRNLRDLVGEHYTVLVLGCLT